MIAYQFIIQAYLPRGSTWTNHEPLSNTKI